MAAAANDDRALFCSAGHTLDVEKVTEFSNGYGVAKWTNFTSTGAAAKNASFPDTDFFLFRLAEAYLTYAEATARTNGGKTTTEGTGYINGGLASSTMKVVVALTLSASDSMEATMTTSGSGRAVPTMVPTSART